MEKNSVHAKQHPSYWTFTVLGLIIPYIGIIVGIVYLTKPEPLDRKVGEHTIVMGILGLVFAWFLYGWIFSSGIGSITTSTSIPSSITSPSVASQSVSKTKLITFTNTSVKSQYGMTTVVGEVKNGDTQTHSMYLKATLYGENGKILGTASGAINDLAPGDIKTFDLLSGDDVTGYKTVKVQVDSLL